MTEVDSGIEQILQREELRHPEKIRFLQRQLEDIIWMEETIQ